MNYLFQIQLYEEIITDNFQNDKQWQDCFNEDGKIIEKEWASVFFDLYREDYGEQIQLKFVFGVWCMQTDNEQIFDELLTMNHCYCDGIDIGMVQQITFDDLSISHNFIGHNFWEDEKARIHLHCGKFWNNSQHDNPYFDDETWYYLLTDFERTFWKIVGTSGDSKLWKKEEQKLFENLGFRSS